MAKRHPVQCPCGHTGYILEAHEPAPDWIGIGSSELVVFSLDRLTSGAGFKSGGTPDWREIFDALHPFCSECGRKLAPDDLVDPEPKAGNSPAEGLIIVDRYTFQCPFCHREWVSAGGRVTGFLKGAARRHVAACQNRSPEQRRQKNRAAMAAVQHRRWDGGWQEIRIPASDRDE